jgi:hypothetical protein
MTVKDVIRAAAGWLPDLLMVGGAAAISFGAWQIYPPSGWVVGGLFGLVGGLLVARREGA